MQKEVNIFFSFKAVILLLAIFGMIIFLGRDNVRASQCDQYEGDAKEECEDNIDKADEYEKLIKINEEKKASQTNQWQIINLEKQKNSTTINQTQEKITNLGQQIYDLEGKIYEKEESIITLKNILTSLLRSYQENFNSGATVIRYDMGNIFIQSDYTSQISSKIIGVLDLIRKEKEDIEDLRKITSSKKDESEELKENLKVKGYSLQSSANTKYSQIQETQKDIDRYQEKLAKVESEIYSLEAGKTYADLGDLDDFSFPAKPTRITQYYGYTSFASSSSFYKNKFHNGVDFSGKSSDGYARAVADGKVLATGKCYKSGEWYAYGRWVAIKHEGEDADYVTFYAHLDSDSVSKGDKVDQGEKIGKIGNTGNSTAPHLHFSLFTISSFKVVESSTVDGLYYPTGTSANPMAYF